MFVHTYVLVDDLIKNGPVVIPPRPGPAPACTDAEIITIELVRHLLCRRSESGFLAEFRREWPGLFPSLPHPSEVNRRTRRLCGAFEQIRQAVVGTVPADDRGQIDTSALPVKHPSRVRGPEGLVEGAEHLVGLLDDTGFNGRAFTRSLAAQGIRNLVPPTKAERKTMPRSLQKIIAEWRNRVETTFRELTDTMELARHGAHTFHGLLTRTAATIAAHALARMAQPST